MPMLTCPRCDGLTPQPAGACLHCDAPLARPRRSSLARRLSVLLGPAGTILLAACYGGPGMYGHQPVRSGPNGAQRLDDDHDGAFGPWTCTHAYDVARCEEAIRGLATPDDLDCDDHDPARAPGAADPDGDGVDQDCDGVDGRRDPASAVTPVPGSGRTYATPPPAP
jgi:hypothetical protein